MQIIQTPAIATSFVRKLYRILDQESAAIIAWDADGTSFVMLDSDALETQVLPRYFRGRLSAFRQQLKEHSFVAVPVEQGQERYRHQFFRRGCPEELNQITHTPMPRKRPPRRKKRKQPPEFAELAAATASDVKIVKNSACKGVHRVTAYPVQQEPEPTFKHAVVDPISLASNPLFAGAEPLSGFMQGLTVDGFSVRSVDPTSPLTDGMTLMKDEPMSDTVMEALLTLLSSSMSTDGRDATSTDAAGTKTSTSSTTSGNIFEEGRPPVVLPPLPPGIVENGQFSDDTLNSLMHWVSANGTNES